MRGNESLVYRMVLFRSCSPRSQCEADQPVPLEASYKITAAPTVINFKTSLSGISHFSSDVFTTYRSCHPEESEKEVFQFVAFSGKSPPHSCSVTAAVPSCALRLSDQK